MAELPPSCSASLEKGFQQTQNSHCGQRCLELLPVGLEGGSSRTPPCRSAPALLASAAIWSCLGGGARLGGAGSTPPGAAQSQSVWILLPAAQGSAAINPRSCSSAACGSCSAGPGLALLNENRSSGARPSFVAPGRQTDSVLQDGAEHCGQQSAAFQLLNHCSEINNALIY